VPVRDRGFALILVLVAASAIFAMAVHGAVMMRSATVETRVVSERARAETDARTAASMLLTGLITTPEVFIAHGGGGEGGAAGAAGSRGGPSGEEEEEPERRTAPELPPGLKELIEQMVGKEKLDELEQGAKEAAGGGAGGLLDGGGLTGRAPRVSGSRRIDVALIPPGPVEVRPPPRGPRCFVRLMDASALLNINGASREQIIRYALARGLPEEVAPALADQIIDWRDADDVPGPYGAEQPAYTPLGIRCANAPFRAVEELLFLPVVTPDLFAVIRDDLTIAGDGRVHAGSASREVLASLPGMDPGLADRIIAERAAGPLTERSLERILPLYAREAREMLRTDPSGILRVRVRVEGDTPASFEGLAVLGERGVRALGLRPVFE
jgi:hypothetical protein